MCLTETYAQKMKFPDLSRFSQAKINEFPDFLDVKKKRIEA